LDPLIRTVSAWDGLPIHVRVWEGDPGRPPILCLPGLVRTGGDFETLIPAIAEGRRAIAPDYLGRGDSAWPRDLGRSSPEACMRDMLDVCAALHVHRALVIGTSFGGLMAMALAAARPSLVRAAVLNDIGPDVGLEGAAFVRDFVGFDPALPTLEACVDLLRAKLPPLSLQSGEDWRRMAELTYRRGPDGRFHPLWDVRLTTTLAETARNLWPLWGALAHVPVLLVRGGVSNLLLPETVERMQAERPDMRVVTVPEVGHAPILTEPVALAAMRSFAEAHA
jgi:pimeloyl-ACP methyl ester carboxylesterase